jgi:hypothetical protein
MANLLIEILDNTSTAIPDIAVNCNFYLEYQNTTTGRKLVSSILYNITGVSDSRGIVRLNSDKIIQTNEFTKYWELYLSDVARGEIGTFELRSKTTSKPTDKYSSFSDIIEFSLSDNSKDIAKEPKTGFYSIPEISYSNVITPLDIDDSKVDIDTLEKNFKDAEDTYITAKKIFEENLKLVDTSKIFEKLTEYEPSNWNRVLTRLLEFEEGTLDAGLRFCKKTGLDEEFKRLDMIKTSILYLKNIYPDINISDGEGIPYGKQRIIK